MHTLRGLTRNILSLFGLTSKSTTSVEQGNYLKNGSAVLEEFLALCDGNCRTPIHFLSATEIDKAIELHSGQKMDYFNNRGGMVNGSLDNRLVSIRFLEFSDGIYRDIAITPQMSRLKNVLRLVGCCLEFEAPVMVYEYVEAVTLDDLLFERFNHKQSLSWGRRLRIANEIASALVYLHSEFKTPIIYGGLKPSNVIVDKNSGVAKLFDFSFSISLPGESQLGVTRVCGTYRYVAPEYASSGIVTQKSDIYSLGVILLGLLAGGNVRNISGQDNVMDMVDPAILEEHGTGIQQQLQDYFNLVNKCRSSNGEDRPYMIEVAGELRRIHKCFPTLLFMEKIDHK